MILPKSDRLFPIKKNAIAASQSRKNAIKKGGGARYQKDHKKGAEAPLVCRFYSSLVLFFLRLKATPNPAAVIEPRIVRGCGTRGSGTAPTGLRDWDCGRLHNTSYSPHRARTVKVNSHAQVYKVKVTTGVACFGDAFSNNIQLATPILSTTRTHTCHPCIPSSNAPPEPGRVTKNGPPVFPSPSSSSNKTAKSI